MKTAANLVLYDDQCPFCVVQMRALKRLDWFEVISVLPMSSPRTVEIVPGVSREQLMEAIRCVTKDGTIYSGARCFRYLALRIPLLVPLALILWVPGVIQVAEKAYHQISRNRYVLSRLVGCREACPVTPADERRGEKPAPTPAGKP